MNRLPTYGANKPAVSSVPKQEADAAPAAKGAGVHSDLSTSQSRVEQLTRLLLEAQDVIISAQAKLSQKDQELLASAAALTEAKQELAEAKEAHRQDAMELTASEMRELGTKAELERANSDIMLLQREIERLRRRVQPVSWSQRIFGS